ETAADASKCIVVHYTTVRTADFGYAGADPINVVAMDSPATALYDYLLRTDIDTMVTPAFATWRPSQLTTGIDGAFCFESEPTCGRLKAVSAELNLAEPQDDARVGVSWYGPASLVRKCAKLSLRVMDYLHKHEFNATERSWEYYGVQIRGWPTWHYGIMDKYANHIALQHCTRGDGGGLSQLPDMMDFSTESSAAIGVHAHLRPSQSLSADFSAKKYSRNEYDEVDVEDLDTSKVNEFALAMAIAANPQTTNILDLTNGLNETFTRAAVVFLPSTKDSTKFLTEFRWFHKSWDEMIRHQPPKWRTDIVVFTDGNDVPLLRELGCIDAIRTSANDSNACIVVPKYKKVKSADFNYGFADSINVVAIDHAATLPYDWILRSDIDTFFTPVFGKWRPTKLTVGSVGGYCFDGYNTCDRLQGIARKLNLTDPTVDDVGSTWYGPAKVIQECAKLSMHVINHLHLHEFTDAEKNNGVDGWPRWHYGVLTMYSGHMAIPHCTKDIGGFDKRNDLIDYPTYSTGKVSRHAHLHTYQSGNQFNKFKFRAGDYDDQDLMSLDLTTVSDYATYMALVGNHKGAIHLSKVTDGTAYNHIVESLNLEAKLRRKVQQQPKGV
ncbi:hypothetical protein As57867_005249, partial [Aphanomyces stellatus]